MAGTGCGTNRETGVATGGGQQRKGPHRQAGQGMQGWVYGAQQRRAGYQHPRTGIQEGPPGSPHPRDWHPGGAPRTGTREGPPGPLCLQDRHLGGAPRTTMPLGQAPRRGPQDHCTPGTTVPLGRAFGRGPQDHCAPGMDIWERPPGPLHPRDYRAPSEAESCPGGCLSPPAQALVLTQLLCSSSELTEATS